MAIAPANSITLPSPAKINLFLRVLGQREDGYHHLQTAFQFLDLCDEVTVTLRADSQITVSCENLDVAVEDNLLLRAARALQDQTSSPQGCDIVCHKHIPVGAGLGGGSSNAATVLLALNDLWRCDCTQETLLALALSLGADVPIFVYGYAAWAEGVGEQFTAMPNLAPSWVLILDPRCHISTADIFRHPDCPRDQPAYAVGQIPINHNNDLQDFVCQLVPEVGVALSWLQQRHFSWLTGSGCAIVSSFETRAAAERVLEQIPVQWRGFVAQASNVSSLRVALNAL